MSDSNYTLDDLRQVAQRALQKANENERKRKQLREEFDEAIDDLVAVKLRLSEKDDTRPYDQLDRDTKIGMVREHAFRRANEGRGTATLDYKDIMWSVFDGEPGPHHCYDLMRWASEARGFVVKDPPTESRHLFADAAEARRGLAFCPENKATTNGGR